MKYENMTMHDKYPSHLESNYPQYLLFFSNKTKSFENCPVLKHFSLKKGLGALRRLTRRQELQQDDAKAVDLDRPGAFRTGTEHPKSWAK